MEHGALAAYHKEEHLLEQARRSFAAGKGPDQATSGQDKNMEQVIKDAVAAEIRRRGKGKGGEEAKGEKPKGDGKAGGAGRPNP